MGLVEIATGKVLSSFSVFLFLTILLLVVARRISTSVLLFSVQSAIIAAEVFATGFRERLAEAYVVGALILVIKVVAIPRAFFGLVDHLKTSHDVKASTAIGARTRGRSCSVRGPNSNGRVPDGQSE